MTANFRRWEVDPFFAAAEDVQDSADRLESAYRTWIHIKAVTRTPSEELEATSSIDFRRRELTTAMGTAKWQLEEFERAVTEASSTDQVYVGEDAPVRHKQFVEAIRNQINSIEEAILRSENVMHLSTLPTAKLGDADRDNLAMFLSGNKSLDSNIENVVRINIVETHQPKEETPSGSSAITESRGQESSRYILPTSSLERTPTRIETGVSDSTSPDGTETHEIVVLDSCSFQRDALQRKLANGSLDIMFEQPGHAISDNSAEDRGSEGRFYSDSDRRRAIAMERVNGQRRSASVDSGLNSWQHEKISTIAGNTILESERTSSVANGLNLWTFFKLKRRADKLKISKSGFKRWKDGEANSKDEREMSVYFNLNGGTSDLKLGTSDSLLGGSKKVLNGYGLEVSSNGQRYLNGLRKTVQHLLQRSKQALPSSRPIQIVFAILVALGLVSMYLWLLSSLVTYDEAVLQGSFPN